MRHTRWCCSAAGLPACAEDRAGAGARLPFAWHPCVMHRASGSLVGVHAGAEVAHMRVCICDGRSLTKRARRLLFCCEQAAVKQRHAGRLG